MPSESIEPGRIVDQQAPAVRRIGSKHADEIHQICLVDHMIEVGVGEIGAPQHVAGAGGDQRPARRPDGAAARCAPSRTP